MLVIADNLSVRNKAYMEAVKKKDKKAIEAMAKELAAKGADMINVQVSLDGVGDEDAPADGGRGRAAGRGAAALPRLAEREGAQERPSRSARNRRSSTTCPRTKRTPMNSWRLVRETKSNLIIRALKGTVPATLEAKLMIIEDLIEKANAADVPNERIFADPSVVHISKGNGQEHLLNAHESIVVLNEMVDPPLNTAVWISNVTTGLPKNLKSTVASTYLAYLAGAGLSAAMVNVKDAELMKVVYLIKTFRDEITFAAGDLG